MISAETYKSEGIAAPCVLSAYHLYIPVPISQQDCYTDDDDSSDCKYSNGWWHHYDY